MAQFQFVMRSGPTPGVTFPLEGDQLIIGRDASNSITINDAEISRKHSRLSFQGGKYVLEDLGSTNGTFVNGQRIGLGQAARKVETHQQLVEVAGNKGCRDLAVVGAGRRQFHVVLVDQFLLLPHRVLLLDGT